MKIGPPEWETKYRCKTCESMHDDMWDALACYRSHSVTLAVETVVTEEPDWNHD